MKRKRDQEDAVLEKATHETYLRGKPQRVGAAFWA